MIAFSTQYDIPASGYASALDRAVKELRYGDAA
jgi:hypothetical protein